MFQSPIPDSVDGRKIFAHEAHIQGRVAVNKLIKLSELLAGHEGFVEVSLDFAIDPRLGRTISGRLVAAVQVCCQRCLQPLDIALTDDIRLVVLNSPDQVDRIKELEALDKQIDPWFCGDDNRIDLINLVDEQMLLSIPIVNYHDDGGCMERIGYSVEQAWLDAARDGANPDSPFAVLGKLKKGKVDKQ